MRLTAFFGVFLCGSALVVLSAASCSSTPDDTSDAATTPETGPMADCPSGYSKCGSDCVPLKRDPVNCGACGKACKAGEVCTQGGCALTCGGAATKCGNACVDTKSNPDNCGMCGQKCPMGQVCSLGKCATSCQMGLTDCSGACVDLNVDDDHCGTCNTTCDLGQKCSNGKCAATCQQGLTSCPTDGGGTTCVNLTTDPSNCGQCGTTCPMGQFCSPGADGGPATCGLACFGGTTKCGNKCVDLNIDPQNCGACNVPCSGTCFNGMCCSGNQLYCNGACRDTKTDKNHCGGCGIVCGGVCNNGVCCGVNDVICNGKCANLQTDPLNCSQCGNVCSGGTPYCNAGMCTSGVLYSKAFTGMQVPPAQHCTDWNTFRASLSGSYSSITVFGSNDMTGRTCTGSNANLLCNALRTGGPLSVMCDGNAWYAGQCSTGIEITADSQCTCTSKYAVRPCINHQDWGGVTVGSCGQASQTLSVLCQ